jgi:hypothetical protein
MRKSSFFIGLLLLFFVSTSSFYGCNADLYLPTDPDVEAYYQDPMIIRVGSIKKVNSKVISNGFYLDAIHRRAQGMAISDSVLYRFYTTGMCKTFDIRDLERPAEIATFKLGSYNDSNHANSAQFYTDNEGRKLLYLSGMGGKCYVESITPTSSSLVQTITLDKINYLQNSVRVNMICGDDGYMWLFGIDNKGDMLVFARANRPDITLKEAKITQSDILDYWYRTDYKYLESISQGGKFYGGNLFFVFGSQTTDRHLDVYNVCTHEMVYSVDLNEAVTEEPEDCDILGNKIILSVDSGKGYYILEMVN